MTVKSRSEQTISFVQGLVVISRTHSKFPNNDYRAIIYTEIDDIESAYRKIKDLQLSVISPVRLFGNKGTRETFSFYDFDGNVVEVFSKEKVSK